MSALNLHQVISKIAVSTPKKIAIEFGNRDTTYGELLSLSDKMASMLVKYTHENKNTAVFMENSDHLVIACLGILKSNTIFVPIDVKLPVERARMMLELINPACIITCSEWSEKLQSITQDLKNVNIVVMDNCKEQDNSYNNIHSFRSFENNESLELPTDTAKNCYIYFTSGSTGKPKGILGRHKSLKHFIDWEIQEFKIDEDIRVAQLTSPSFDPYLRDIFVPLCSGGTICIPDTRDILLDPSKLLSWFEEKKISLVHMVPSLFKTLVPVLDNPDGLKSLKYIMLAGEILRGNDVKAFMNKYDNRITLVNLYGPTETTLAKFFHIITKEDSDKAFIPVGKPINHTQALVLDNNLRVCEHQKEGEIYIRTPFISSGYYMNKEETQKAFIQNPYSSNPQDIIYKTGDIGKVNTNGDLEVLGRIDFQVKLRGHRIELSEIENALLKHPVVKDSVVDLKEINGEKLLCGYLIVKDDGLTNRSLREYLGEKIPQYMIPSVFVRLKEFPLSPNGKIDKKALPIPLDKNDTDYEFAAPENKTEEIMVEIWKEVLGVNRISIDDSFFHLGGHSLKAASLVENIKKRLNINLSITDVLKNPSIRELSVKARNAEHGGYLSLMPVEEKEYYPATKTQKRMYVLNILQEDSIAYNINGTALIEGNLKSDQVKNTFKQLISRHDSLRTSFHMIEGELVQKVNKEVELDISYLESTEQEARGVISEFIKPFDLSQAPLLRVGLIKISDNKHILVYDMHHIISDAASKALLAQEFVKLYSGIQLKKERLQFKDYIVWQNEGLQSGYIKRQEEYWVRRFEKSVPVLNLPTDFPRPAVQSFEGDKVDFRIEEGLLDNIRDFVASANITLNILLLAVYNILLMKYTSQEDIVVGVPVLGRTHPDVQNIIGMFVNTLPLRNCPVDSLSFDEFLNTVKERCFEAYENQEYQFDELVTRLGTKRDSSRSILFDTMFSMHDSRMQDISIGDLKLGSFDYENKGSKFDISLEAIDRRKEISLAFVYCTKLFRKNTIERMSQHFINTLKQVIINPNIVLSNIDIISEEEKNTLLLDFNNTKTDFPSQKLIHEYIEEQATKYPENKAVVFEEQSLTYMQLNEKANQLAGYLKEKNVKPDDIIAIMVERSFEMIIGILGILKAGAAYLPIDPYYPADRIEYILEDSGTSLLLTCTKYNSPYKFSGMTIDLENSEIYKGSANNPEKACSSRNLAYVIYTSGSTGKPKGAMIEHRSLVNRINWMQKAYPLNQTDVILQKTPYTFDVSLWELVWWSYTGSTMCLLVPGGEKNPEEIVKAIEKNKVTIMHFVPSMLNAFLEYMDMVEDKSKLSTLRRVFASGEALTLKQVEKFNSILNENFGTQLTNLYGPTEATVDVSYYDCSTEKLINSIPIGKPIDNISLYILDKNNKLKPIGVPGELYISGVGLARGYLNNPSLTGERFINYPFVSDQIMYRTGDIARWLEDGNIEYLGRTDHQVKIRGYRIELGEIEANIMAYQGVKEGVVISHNMGNNNTVLCAYIASEEAINTTALKDFLASRLPAYMVPTYIMEVERIPLTSSGKIDRKLLPDPAKANNSAKEYIAPRNELEKRLETAWRSVLGTECVGINDNFFEVGGNSILLLDLYSVLEKDFTGKIKVVDLFTYSTISKLAAFLGESAYTQEIKLELLQLPEDYLVSGDEEAEASLLKIRQEGELVITLNKLYEEGKIHFTDFFIACFAYLIYDITDTEGASFYTTIGQKKSLLNINAYFSECEDFIQLIKVVKEDIEIAMKEAIPFENVKNVSPSKKTGKVLAFLNIGDTVDSSLTRIFDIIFNVLIDNKELTVTCEYNSSIIKKQKAEAMLLAFIKLIKILINKFFM